MPMSIGHITTTETETEITTGITQELNMTMASSEITSSDRMAIKTPEALETTITTETISPHKMVQTEIITHPIEAQTLDMDKPETVTGLIEILTITINKKTKIMGFG